MDERFKNLSHRPSTKLGMVLLGAICLTMLATNRLIYPLLAFPPTTFSLYISYSLIGVVIAELGLLAVWTVLSSQNVFRRIQFLVFAAVILLAAWLLGFATTFSPDVGINWRNHDQTYYLGWLPMLFLAAALPLIGLRFFFSLVLAPFDEPRPPVKHPVTTTGLMISTAVVAAVLALAQLPTLVGVRQGDVWLVTGTISGIFFTASLLFVLPSVLILCSPRCNFFRWSIVCFAATLLLAPGTIFLATRYFNIPIDDDILVPAQITATAAVVFLVGIATIRSFGYRLMKAEKSAAPKK